MPQTAEKMQLGHEACSSPNFYLTQISSFLCACIRVMFDEHVRYIPWCIRLCRGNFCGM
jgi:hypothetical protein